MSEYLFAYGTLQAGCAPAKIAHAAAKLKAVGGGWVRGALYDFGGYPGAVPDGNATGKIYGTVMELPEDASLLRALDAYEGYNPGAPAKSEYIREMQRVEMANGAALECWFYRYNWKTDGARGIASGEWQDRDS